MPASPDASDIDTQLFGVVLWIERILLAVWSLYALASAGLVVRFLLTDCAPPSSTIHPCGYRDNFLAGVGYAGIYLLVPGSVVTLILLLLAEARMRRVLWTLAVCYSLFALAVLLFRIVPPSFRLSMRACRPALPHAFPLTDAYRMG